MTSWLVTVTRSRSIDRLRAQARRTRLEEPLPEHVEVRSQMIDPEDQTLMSQQRKRVMDALNELTLEQRQALDLAYFGGLSHSELAARLELPLGTVKTRIRLGMIKMRELLG